MVAALTGMAAFTAAAAGLSNSSTPLQFGLAAISALLSGGLAYWQADLLSQHRNSPGDNRAAHFPRTNLPTPLSSFVGRTGEIAVAERLLQEGRLVTLVGAGGCGKSRLGLEVADRVAGNYPDGVWLADLAELPDGNLLVERISKTLGVPDAPEGTPLQSLTRYLRPRRLLLLLDNCEHLLEACAEVAAAVLEASASSRLLATSRQPLGVVGEKVMRVGPLPTPDPADPPALERAVTYDAVRLFRDRTRDLVRDFEITATNASTVADG